MRRVGQARRRDGPETAIIDALEGIGVLCQRLSEPGFADVVTCHRGQLRLLEIKSPVGRLTPAQLEVHGRWPICVVRDVPSALALFGVTI